MKGKLITIAFFALSISACTWNKSLVAIQYGGYVNDSIQSAQKGKSIEQGQCYASYTKNGETINLQSNTIEFYLSEKIDGFDTQQMIEHNKKNPIKRGATLVDHDLEKYAYARITNEFYKSKPLKPFWAVIGILAGPLTLGTSWFNMVPNNCKTYETYPVWVEIYTGDTYDYRNLSFKNQILTEVNVFCKNDKINDSLIVTQIFPEGTQLRNFKIKAKKGEKVKVEHTSSNKDGKEYHEYKILPVDKTFNHKKTKVWIIQNVSISQLDKYKLN